MYFESFSFPIYWIITLLCLCYKGLFTNIGLVLPFSNAAYSLEMVAIFAFGILELSRLFLGNYGNKTESLKPTILFLVLSVVAAAGYLFFGLWQSYVLLIDLLINIIQLCILVGQILTGFALALQLSKQLK